MINSVYGKTMEYIRKRISVRLVHKAENFLKYTSRPIYVARKIFSENYAAIHEIKPVLMLNKVVLELSKWLMFDFHYNFIKNVLLLNYCLLTRQSCL